MNSKEAEEEKTCLARKPGAGGDDVAGEVCRWGLLVVDRVVLEAQREDKGRKMATRVRTLDDMAGIEL